MTPFFVRPWSSYCLVFVCLRLSLFSLSFHCFAGMQNIFAGQNYNKPFFVTYVNTASFSFYLLGPLFRHWRESSAGGSDGYFWTGLLTRSEKQKSVASEESSLSQQQQQQQQQPSSTARYVPKYINNCLHADRINQCVKAKKTSY